MIISENLFNIYTILFRLVNILQQETILIKLFMKLEIVVLIVLLDYNVIPHILLCVKIPTLATL